MLRHLLLTLACAFVLSATAQPTWRFHLAFEDGTGARDTIWMVYDTTATLGSNPWPGPNVDTLLGEGPVNLNDGLFHVFRTNAVGDTTQTNAFPFSWFPIFDGTLIDAINWVPPMTIRWDTSLFHAPYLPYEQGSFGVARMDGMVFFFINNHPELQAFDMLIDNSVTVTDLSDMLFPFSILFGENDGLGVSQELDQPKGLTIYPNPVTTTLVIRCPGPSLDVSIYNMTGHLVFRQAGLSSRSTMDMASLAPGAYILIAHSPQNQTYHGFFQKVD